MAMSVQAAPVRTASTRVPPPGDTGRLSALLGQALEPASVSRPAVAALALQAREWHFDAGALILSRTEPARALWLVTSGSVALGIRNSAGALQHSRSVRAVAWIDCASAWLQGLHIEDAVAESAAVLWELPLDAVLDCSASHPELLQAVATVLAARNRELTLGAHQLVTRTALARCASWLLEQAQAQNLAQGAGGEDAVVAVRLKQPKRDIALRLGSTAETFSRMLRRLSMLGMIRVRGSLIEVLDLPGLRRESEAVARHPEA